MLLYDKNSRRINVNHQNGVVNLKFFGIPTCTYVVQTTANVSSLWWSSSTNTAGSDGSWVFTDLNTTNTQQYYRTSQP